MSMRAACVASRPTVLPLASMTNHLRFCSRSFPEGTYVCMARISKSLVEKTNGKHTKGAIYCQAEGDWSLMWRRSARFRRGSSKQNHCLYPLGCVSRQVQALSTIESIEVCTG